MILIDPGFRPIPALPVFLPFKPVHQEPHNQIDKDILVLLRDAPEPVGVWTMVNEVAELYPARNRAERRARRKEVLDRINPLVRAKLARRMGKSYLTLGLGHLGCNVLAESRP